MWYLVIECSSLELPEKISCILGVCTKSEYRNGDDARLYYSFPDKDTAAEAKKKTKKRFKKKVDCEIIPQ
jgi:hypothetical protein